mmetsp:Transcript_64139/g.171692  ORF Transcript_64139/g.171692 Transcript_64139/m.171692 type:complete len:100 (+) Transcript_64139:86-385(+)
MGAACCSPDEELNCSLDRSESRHHPAKRWDDTGIDMRSQMLAKQFLMPSATLLHVQVDSDATERRTVRRIAWNDRAFLVALNERAGELGMGFEFAVPEQ